MFIKILILSIIASVAVAGNPDAPGYIEPHISFGVGNGTTGYDMSEWDTKPRDISISVIGLTPLSKGMSLLLSGDLQWYKSEWGQNRIDARTFQISIGIRFYLKGD